MTHELWASLNQKLEDVLSEATLAKLVEQNKERQKLAQSGIAYVKIDPASMRRSHKNTAQKETQK